MLHSSVSCYLESQERGVVMVAQHGRWGIGHGELVADGRVVQRAGADCQGHDGSGCADGAG
jgi:hypothetical protein